MRMKTGIVSQVESSPLKVEIPAGSKAVKSLLPGKT
jgi:hypothetical protein